MTKPTCIGCNATESLTYIMPDDYWLCGHCEVGVLAIVREQMKTAGIKSDDPRITNLSERMRQVLPPEKLEPSA